MSHCPKCGARLQGWPYGLNFCVACGYEENRRKDPERLLDVEVFRDWLQKHGGDHGYNGATDEQNK